MSPDLAVFLESMYDKRKERNKIDKIKTVGLVLSTGFDLVNWLLSVCEKKKNS